MNRRRSAINEAEARVADGTANDADRALIEVAQARAAERAGQLPIGETGDR